MRILQICHRVPFPLQDGGNIAMLQMALGLKAAGADVVQFAINTKKHFTEPEELPEFIRKGLNFHSAPIDTSVRLSGVIKNIFSSGSYNVERFYSKEVESAIVSVLKENQFDIVQLETLFATPYIKAIRQNSSAKIILRAHNAEHLIWKRMAETESSFLRSLYLRFLSRRLKKYERRVLKNIDALVPITAVDEKHFRELGYQGPMQTIPLGINLEEYPHQVPDGNLKLFHLGSMDWLPNQEAVRWFIDKCWRPIHALAPDLELHLAGRGFPEDLLQRKVEGVFMQGRIEDAVQFMEDKQIMIVPLLSGSGMRVKIIQGLALGKTIISTTIGAEGIDVSPGKNILIADSPPEFLEKIRLCLFDPEHCREIGLAGRKLVEEKYTNEALGKQLMDFYSWNVVKF